jgi:hypothetical protein
MEIENQASENENKGSDWRNLYKVGASAALVMAVFIPVQIIIFILWPPPDTVTGWFALFQNNWLIGLLDLDLLLIVDQILVGMVLLSLFIILRKTNPSAMLIALVLGLIGIAAYFASTIAFEMLSLSNQYTAATEEAQKSIILASGQVMLANWQGTAFNVGYIIEAFAFLITGIVMLHSGIFGKAASYFGIALGVMSLLPPTAGLIGMIFALGSLVPLEIWNILVALKLIKLAAT